VSNFIVADIQEAVRHVSEPLVCNQIEMNSFLDRPTVTAASRAHGMAVVAYSPIARGEANNDAMLARIGQAYGKSGAQVSLRWLVQQGIPVIPRTSRIARLTENYTIFDFELSEVEMSSISSAARRRARLDATVSPLRDFAHKTLPGPAYAVLPHWLSPASPGHRMTFRGALPAGQTVRGLENSCCDPAAVDPEFGIPNDPDKEFQCNQLHSNCHN
jgi:Aldo/keto reductase family